MPRQLGDDLCDPLPFARGKAGGRLIEEKQTGLTGQRQGELQLSALAIGKMLDGVGDSVSEPYAVKLLRSSGLAFRKGCDGAMKNPLLPFGPLDSEKDIFQHGEFWEYVGDLKCAADPHGHTLVFSQPSHLFTKDKDLP